MYKVKGIMYMIHSVALVIADFFVSKDVITEEEKEVCAYGMELIISSILISFVLNIMGMAIRKGKYSSGTDNRCRCISY